MQKFTYLNDELNKDFIEAFNNMQDKYIIREDYRLKLEDVKTKLEFIKNILIKYDLWNKSGKNEKNKKISFFPLINIL